METLIRFLTGGFVVSAFAVIGGLFKPASFAGLFGAAPSVALAPISLVVAKEGKSYASAECRSMIAGAAAFAIYSLTVTWLMMRGRMSALTSTISATFVWFFAAFGLWRMFLR